MCSFRSTVLNDSLICDCLTCNYLVCYCLICDFLVLRSDCLIRDCFLQAQEQEKKLGDKKGMFIDRSYHLYSVVRRATADSVQTIFLIRLDLCKTRKPKYGTRKQKSERRKPKTGHIRSRASAQPHGIRQQNDGSAKVLPNPAPYRGTSLIRPPSP